MSQITVDTENATATLVFDDDKGDVTAAPANAVVAFSTSDSTVATIAVDPSNPLQGDITPVAEGTFTVSATTNGTALDANGNPLPDPAASDPISVVAGAAASESLTLQNAG